MWVQILSSAAIYALLMAAWHGVTQCRKWVQARRVARLEQARRKEAAMRAPTPDAPAAGADPEFVVLPQIVLLTGQGYLDGLVVDLIETAPGELWELVYVQDMTSPGGHQTARVISANVMIAPGTAPPKQKQVRLADLPEPARTLVRRSLTDRGPGSALATLNAMTEATHHGD